MQFDVLLERDEDGVWAVTVPALPGCFTQGATREVALANAKEAIALHLEGATPLPIGGTRQGGCRGLRDGRPPPPPVPEGGWRLAHVGFQVIRQRGGHVRYQHPDGRAVTVLHHAGRDVARGTLQALLRYLDLTPDEFEKLI